MLFRAFLAAALPPLSVYMLAWGQGLLPEQVSAATGQTFGLMILRGGLVTWCEGFVSDLWGGQASVLVTGVALPLSAAAPT